MLGGRTRIDSSHPFSSRQLPAMVVAAAVVLRRQHRGRRHRGRALPGRADPPLLPQRRVLCAVTGAVMLMVAPLVIAAAAYSVVLVPLFLAPMLAVYNTVWQRARNEYAARHDALTGCPTAPSSTRPSTPRSGTTRRPLRAADRPRSLQGGQRHARPPLRRPAAKQVAERFRDSSASWPDRPPRRRRVRDHRPAAPPGRAPARPAVADPLSDPFELEQIVVDAQASVGIALYPSTAPTSRRCSRRPTSRCTAPRRRAPTWRSTTSATITTAPPSSR